ncbi:hypothetical protein ACFOW1_00855 [Parasediminibacterium paludis]|uniref:PIN domain-containing protein n=1 Tax=Parasediminibacterium paludis TaxID=908966 RepID=A0ABV8PT51_9BACT
MPQTNDNYFIDSNICLYLISEDLYKKEIAKNLLLPNSSFISIQVLSENINVLIKKFKQLSIDAITKHINLLIKYNNVVTIKPSDITSAILIKQNTSFSV